MKRNVPLLGFIFGLVAPLAGMLVVYGILFRGMTFEGFLTRFTSDPQVAAKVLTLSILANLIPFLYFTNRRLDLSARGVFIATMLYAVAIVLLKFVW
jgi:hypothetical protein